MGPGAGKCFAKLPVKGVKGYVYENLLLSKDGIEGASVYFSLIYGIASMRVLIAVLVVLEFWGCII